MSRCDLPRIIETFTGKSRDLKSRTSQQFILFVAALAGAAIFCGVASATDPPSDGDGNEGEDRESGEYLGADPVPHNCALEIARAFVRDDKGDPLGQRRLDAILNKFGYAPGSLNYESDNLKRVGDVEKKLRRKKHKTRSSPPPEESLRRGTGPEKFIFSND